METDTYTKYLEQIENQKPSRLERVAETMRSLSHKMAMIPIVNFFLNSGKSPFAFLLSGAAALFDSIGSVSRGRYTEGVKKLVSGGVDMAVVGAMAVTGLGALGAASVWWVASAFSSIATGDTLPELMRKGTKSLLDVLDGSEHKKIDPLTAFARQNQILGVSPQTVGMSTAGVGYAPWVPQQAVTQPNPMMPGAYPTGQMPQNFWTNKIAEQQGMNPVDKRINWARSEDNRQHYRELHAAKQQMAAEGMMQPQRS